MLYWLHKYTAFDSYSNLKLFCFKLCMAIWLKVKTCLSVTPCFINLFLSFRPVYSDHLQRIKLNVTNFNGVTNKHALTFNLKLPDVCSLKSMFSSLLLIFQKLDVRQDHFSNNPTLLNIYKTNIIYKDHIV